MARTESIRGVLRTGSGQVLVGARVEVVDELLGSCSFASDEAGRVAIPGLPVGDYELRVTAIDGRPLLPIAVSCARGVPAVLPALEFEPTGEVNGVVRDASGRPCPAEVVELTASGSREVRESTSRCVWTDRRGRFRARNLPVGKWGVKTNHAKVLVTLEAGTVAEVVLEPR
jgi:hypothetical protein